MMTIAPQGNASRPTSRRHLIFVWLATGLFIPCLSALGRPLQHWTYQNLGETAAAWIIGLLLVGLGALAVRWLSTQSLSGNHLALLLLSAALATVFITIVMLLPRTEERLHFVTFGLFGFLSRRVLPTTPAILVTLVWSGGDELFQHWLAERVGDWRDVAMNALAGTLGLILAWLGKRPSRK